MESLKSFSNFDGNGGNSGNLRARASDTNPA